MPAENTKFSSISRAICYFVPRKSYSGKTRFHRWNDFDRLTFSLGHDFCGYYGYDADGIRTYKLMGTCNISTLNGGGLQAQAVFDDMVLYPSPYMVVTPRGYTNHYYAGSERIASRVGNRCWSITPTDEWEIPSPEEEALQNFWNIAKEEYPFGDEKGISSPTTNVTLDENYDQYVQYSCTPVFLPEVDVLYNQDMIKTAIGCGYSGQNEAPVYYYHPDHLGSTSWVTDEAGHEHQFIAYLPYGEPLLNVLYDNYDSRYGLIKDARYKFTGKERDAETGYDYMEQRYYYPPLAFWLRPDPLLDKYIHLSPYAYCNGNPLIFVDPNGRDTLHFDANGNYTHRVQSEGPHIGIWHKSNNSVREFRFQDPNDANRFMTQEEFENSEMSSNDDMLKGIMIVSLSSVYKATRPSISDRLKGRYIAALSGTANGSMDYMRVNEPNYNMAYDAQQKLMLVDGIPLAQQPCNMGNMLWGLKMQRLGFSLPACLLGAHVYTIYGGMTGKYPKIELDSFDDQCSIILGFMLWLGL